MVAVMGGTAAGAAETTSRAAQQLVTKYARKRLQVSLKQRSEPNRAELMEFAKAACSAAYDEWAQVRETVAKALQNKDFEASAEALQLTVMRRLLESAQTVEAYNRIRVDINVRD